MLDFEEFLRKLKNQEDKYEAETAQLYFVINDQDNDKVYVEGLGLMDSYLDKVDTTELSRAFEAQTVRSNLRRWMENRDSHE
jgi:hypothetical protein